MDELNPFPCSPTTITATAMMLSACTPTPSTRWPAKIRPSPIRMRMIGTASYHARRNGNRALNPDLTVIRCLQKNQRCDASCWPEYDVLRPDELVKQGRTFLSLKHRTLVLSCDSIASPFRALSVR